MKTSMAKVYAAIIAIPLGAICLASAVSGGSDPYDYEDYERDLAAMSDDSASGGSGARVSESEAYSSLGKYNPCIFIACEGE
jgi:hypothetical protein